MQNYQVAESKKMRRELYTKMTTDDLYRARNNRLEQLDSGLQVDRSAIEEINAELKRRGEYV